MAGKSPKLFARESTGLTKSIGAFDVLSFTLLASGPMVLIPLGVLSLPSIYEGANVPFILGLALVLLLPLAYNTTALSSTIPRAGGDYVFGSRIVHPIWGVIPSFMILFSFVTGIGSLVIVTLQAFVGPAIITSYPQFLNATLSFLYLYPIRLFAISLALLIFIFGLAILSTKAWFWFIKIVSLFALFTTLLLFAYLLTTPSSEIASRFTLQNTTGLTFSGVLEKAQASGWTPQHTSSPLVTAGAMIFVFFFLAAPISAYFSSEIKSVAKSMSIGVIGGTLFSWFIATAGLLLFLKVFGYNFLSAYGFLNLSNPSIFTFNSLVLSITGNPNISFVIGLGFALAALGLVAVPMLPASRLLLAWSLDRLIPQRFAYVSDRTHTPVFALTFVGVLSAVVAALDSYYSATIGTFLATTIIVAIAFLPNGVTATLLPLMKKDLYLLAPSIVRLKIRKIPLILITGLIHALGFLILIALVFLNPTSAGTSNGELSSGALIVIVVMFLISIAFYPFVKIVRKRAGIDISIVFKEIPPE